MRKPTTDMDRHFSKHYKAHLTLPGGVDGPSTSSIGTSGKPRSGSGSAGKKSSSRGLDPKPMSVPAECRPASVEGGSDGGLIGAAPACFPGVS